MMSVSTEALTDLVLLNVGCSSKLLNGRTTLEVFQIYCKELAEENKRKKQ